MSRFYCHNTEARATMGLLHETTSGLVVLAFAFANKKDVFSKKMGRAIVDARLNFFLNSIKLTGVIPKGKATPHTYLVGFYDGEHSKNDIFGPLMDDFRNITENRNLIAITTDGEVILKSVMNLELFLHRCASELLILSNQSILV